MDLSYVLLNVHSRLPPVVYPTSWHQSSCQNKNLPYRREKPAASVIICIPCSCFWTPSTNVPHSDTWKEEEEEEEDRRLGIVEEADR